MDLHRRSLQSDVQIERFCWLEHSPDHHSNDVRELSAVHQAQKLYLQ